MEHVTPRHFKSRGIRISEACPWLGFADHDVATNYVRFEGYPASRGWDLGTFFEDGNITSVKDRTGKAPSEDSFWAFVQSYLYFGYLEAITRRRIDIRAFIQKDRQREVMNTEPLITIFEEWRDAVADRRLENVDRILWAKSVIFKEMVCVVKQWKKLASSAKVPIYFYPVLRAVAILNASVGAALMPIYIECIDVCEELPRNMCSMNYHGDLPLFQHLRGQLLSKGYCPFQIENCLILRYHPMLFEYLNSVAEHLLPHPLDRLPEIHRTCTEADCVYYQVNPDQPPPLSCGCGQNCPRLRPEIERITNILSAGKVPGIFYDNTQNRLFVVPLEPGYKYVAFSHVWADGLGSVSEDGLFACQVKRLNKLTRNVFYLQLGQGNRVMVTTADLPKFWIDSLCVPKAKEHRKTAIRLMAETYKNASFVMVLDRTIAHSHPGQNFGDVFPLTFLTRVHLSGWRSWLWTLQESMLSKKILFEIGSAPTIVSEPPFIGERHEGGFTIRVHMESVMEHMLEGSLGLPDTPGSTVNVARVIQCLARRRTSRPSDETLAVASLLGVDFSRSKLLEVAAERRMRQLLIEVSDLPLHLPFLNCPKYKDEGLRWAPQSLMLDSAIEAFNFGGKKRGIGTELGFFAPYVVLQPQKPANAAPWVGRLGDGSCCHHFHEIEPTNMLYCITRIPDGKAADTSVAPDAEFNAIIVGSTTWDSQYTGIAVMFDGQLCELAFPGDDGEYLYRLDGKGDVIIWKSCRYVALVWINVRGKPRPGFANDATNYVKCHREDWNVRLY